MPFKPGNKCTCRNDKLTPEEVRQRKRERAREWRKTHPHDPKNRRKYYQAAKMVLATKPRAPSKSNGHYLPSKYYFAWDGCPENLLNMEDV